MLRTGKNARAPRGMVRGKNKKRGGSKNKGEIEGKAKGGDLQKRRHLAIASRH